MDKQIDYLEK